MYDIFTYMWLKFMVNGGKYTKKYHPTLIGHVQGTSPSRPVGGWADDGGGSLGSIGESR